VVIAWCAAALTGGAALRVYHFLVVRRPLWMDEAMMALNIPVRSFAGLLKPLDYHATAPFPFLWMQHVCVRMWGTNELTLRAVPLLAGLAVIVLVAYLGWRLYGAPGACAAALLAALSPTLIRYSNEVRPYSTDALATASILTASMSVARDPQARWRWLVLGVVAPLGILASYPGLFVVPPALLSLALVPDVRRNHAWGLLACGLLCVLAFGVPYFTIYRPAAGSPELQGAWRAAFLTLEPGLGDRIRLALPGLLLPTFVGIGSDAPAHGVATLWLVGAGLVLGAIEAARRHGAWVVGLLASPIVVAAIASSLRRYPFGVPRHMTFAAPILVLMAAGGIAWFHARLPARVRTPALALLPLLAAGPAARDDVAGVRAPFQGENARRLVAVYRDSGSSKEPIYVSAKAIPAWVFYTTNWDRPNEDRLAFYAAAATHGLAFENRPSRGHAVADEGSDLVYDNRGRREILGVATGREWRWPSYTRPGPDERWAENEASRVRREAVSEGTTRCVWLLFTRLSEHSAKPLLWTIAGLGGTRDRAEHVPGGGLYRYCFDGEPS